MEEHTLHPNDIVRFETHLHQEEYALGTTEKYLRDVRHLTAWLDDRAINKNIVIQWKEHLLADGYAPVTVNSMLASANCFFKMMGWHDCHVKELRIQRRLFRDQEKELTREEYARLLQTANASDKERLALLMETICSTGIRVSEVRYITVEALQVGRAEVANPHYSHSQQTVP